LKFRVSIFFLFVFAIATSAQAQQVQAKINASEASAGIVLQYELSSAAGSPLFQTKPVVDGIRWLDGNPSRGQNVRIVNGRRTAHFSTTYQFVATKAGQLRIPGIGIRLENRPGTLRANDVTLQAQSADHVIKLNLLYNGKPEPPQDVFLGQEIVFGIELLVNANIRVHNAFTNNANNLFPRMELENVVFKDYSKENQYTDKFRLGATTRALKQQTREVRRVGNANFAVYPYETALIPLEPGTIKGKVAHTFIFIPQQQRQDPMRSFFGNRAANIFVEAIFPEIAVKPIPKATAADGMFLGLIGEWQVTASTDKPTVKVSDAVDLIISVRGKGDISTLRAPKLELPGFRQFDPKISKDAASASGTITWTVIPLHKDSQFPELQLSTFSPSQGKFVTHDVRARVTVEEGDPSTTAPPPSAPSLPADSTDLLFQENQPVSQSGILYIKPRLAAYIQVPLAANARGFLLLLLFGGPIGFAATAWLCARQDKLSGNTAYRRRHAAQRKRATVFTALKSASEDERPDVIRNELIPYLIAVKELPPGATTRDLLKVIDDPELTEILESVEASGFMPGSGPKVDLARLLELVGKVSIWMLVGLLANSAISVNAAADPMSVAASAYENNKIEDAEAVYSELQRGDRANAHLLYNLGNCAFQRGDYGLSVARYEQARRLKPRDSDIVENLNFVRGQLQLAPIGNAEDPLSVLASVRDLLRPDEWLRLAALGWLVCWVLLAVRRWKQVPLIIPACVSLGIAGICVMSWFTQQQSTYRDNQGVILQAATPLFAVPHAGDDHDSAKQAIDVGKYVDIQEWRNEWLRVRVDQDEGWVRRSAVAVIWTNSPDFQ
jgi:tetratricopeptide (TPR) repeat protein